MLLEVLSIETLSDSSGRAVQDRRLGPGLSAACARASDVPGCIELVHLVAARGGALVEVGRCVGRECALLDQSCTCLSRGRVAGHLIGRARMSVREKLEMFFSHLASIEAATGLLPALLPGLLLLGRI